jgi:hypothetical protein
MKKKGWLVTKNETMWSLKNGARGKGEITTNKIFQNQFHI